jgi:hypothetical protein
MAHIAFEDYPMYIELDKYYNESLSIDVFNGDCNKFYPKPTTFTIDPRKTDPECIKFEKNINTIELYGKKIVNLKSQIEKINIMLNSDECEDSQQLEEKITSKHEKIKLYQSNINSLQSEINEFIPQYQLKAKTLEIQMLQEEYENIEKELTIFRNAMRPKLNKLEQISAPYSYNTEYSDYIKEFDETTRKNIAFKIGIPNIDDYSKLNILNKKLQYLTFRKECLEKKDEKLWTFMVGKILDDITDKIVPKKSSYDENDISLIGKILAKIFKSECVQDHISIRKNIEKYKPKYEINLSSSHVTIFDSETKGLLLKSLSYFVEISKPEFVSTILQAIDIFVNHRGKGYDLYEEILKNGDPELYKMMYTNHANSLCTGSCEEMYKELEFDLKNQSETVENTKIFKAKGSETFIVKLYNYLNNYNNNNSYGSDKKTYLWRYTTILYSNECVHWDLSCDKPENAHVNYTTHVNIVDFANYVINNTSYFLHKKMKSNKSLDKNQMHIVECKDSDKSMWSGDSEKLKTSILTIPPKSPIKTDVKNISEQVSKLRERFINDKTLNFETDSDNDTNNSRYDHDFYNDDEECDYLYKNNQHDVEQYEVDDFAYYEDDEEDEDNYY